MIYHLLWPWFAGPSKRQAEDDHTSYIKLQVLQMLPEHLQCEVTFQAKVAYFVNPQAGPWRIAWHLYRDPSASSTSTWPDLSYYSRYIPKCGQNPKILSVPKDHKDCKPRISWPHCICYISRVYPSCARSETVMLPKALPKSLP
jgi:hypothetical protein